MSPILIIFIATALVFDFLNGFHDSANIVATMIASRAMSPRRALALSAVAHFAGPFLFGVAVATTIGHEVVQPRANTMAVVLAALLASIAWNLITWFLGIPSSSSHALVGGGPQDILLGVINQVADFKAQHTSAPGRAVKMSQALASAHPQFIIPPQGQALHLGPG